MRISLRRGLAMGVMIAAIAAVAVPAFADPDGWHGHDRWHHHYHRPPPPPHYVYRPGYVYAPPPVVPSFNIVIPLR